MLNLYVKPLTSDAKLPVKSTTHAACWDVYATHASVIHPGELVVIHTDLMIATDPGYCVKLYPRSGLSTKGITLANCVGVIDSDYRDELKVLLTNNGAERKSILKGDRIAQLAVEKVEQVNLILCDELPTTNSNRTGGLGSTGV